MKGNDNDVAAIRRIAQRAGRVMNRSPSPDFTAQRAARQQQRIIGQRVAVSAVQTAAVESVAIAAVEEVVAPGGGLDVRLNSIENRLNELEP
jgi:hypothetical protein